jgi:hypothetical protein
MTHLHHARVDHPGKATGLPPVECPAGAAAGRLNLLEDAEVRFTTTGIAVACLRVAVRQRIQQHCEWRDGETNFLKVNVWHGQADHDEIGASLKFAIAKANRPPSAAAATAPCRLNGGLRRAADRG